MNPYGEPEPETVFDAWFAIGVVFGISVTVAAWILISLIF